MHWFDRLSRQLAAAPEAQTTRRGVLKGVGVAAVATPFASHAVAYANNLMKANSTSDDCKACLQVALDNYHSCVLGCYQTYAGLAAVNNDQSYAGPAAVKKKKKKKRKTTPAESADMVDCMAFCRGKLIKSANVCRTGVCAPVTPPPTTTATGSTTCPAGTAPCPSVGATSTCCFGGDACCPCAATGGYICCAGVIGCVCC